MRLGILPNGGGYPPRLAHENVLVKKDTNVGGKKNRGELGMIRRKNWGCSRCLWAGEQGLKADAWKIKDERGCYRSAACER